MNKKQKLRRSYLRVISKYKRKKLVPFEGLDAILARMTNWQNSQWLRSGAPELHDEDSQLKEAMFYANLKYRGNHL